MVESEFVWGPSHCGEPALFVENQTPRWKGERRVCPPAGSQRSANSLCSLCFIDRIDLGVGVPRKLPGPSYNAPMIDDASDGSSPSVVAAAAAGDAIAENSDAFTGSREIESPIWRTHVRFLHSAASDAAWFRKRMAGAQQHLSRVPTPPLPKIGMGWRWGSRVAARSHSWDTSSPRAGAVARFALHSVVEPYIGWVQIRGRTKGITGPGRWKRPENAPSAQPIHKYIHTLTLHATSLQCNHNRNPQKAVRELLLFCALAASGASTDCLLPVETKLLPLAHVPSMYL